MVRTHTVPAPAAGPDDAALGLVGAHPPTGVLAPGRRQPRPGRGGRQPRRAHPGLGHRPAGPGAARLPERRRRSAAHRPGLPPPVEPARRHRAGRVRAGARAARSTARAARCTPILGPVLNGVGDVAAIPDTDGGRWDGDTTWDRAVGPMQFIPSSWQVWGRDGDGDGRADPSDVDDAALATASYLCAGDRDLRNEKDRRSAVFSYNHSWDYVDLVLAWADAYATGVPLTTDLLPAAGRQAASVRRGAGGRRQPCWPSRRPAPPSSPRRAGTPPGPRAAPARPLRRRPRRPKAAPPTACDRRRPRHRPPPRRPPRRRTRRPDPDPCATPTPTDTPTGDPTDTATPSPTPTDSVTPEPTPTDVVAVPHPDRLPRPRPRPAPDSPRGDRAAWQTHRP